jgi:hypothetical protein
MLTDSRAVVVRLWQSCDRSFRLSAAPGSAQLDDVGRCWKRTDQEQAGLEHRKTLDRLFARSHDRLRFVRPDPAGLTDGKTAVTTTRSTAIATMAFRRT